MANERFTATLMDGHKGAAFEVPFDPAERWNLPRARSVTGKVNGVTFESTIVARSKRFWVLIDDDLRGRANLEIGDSAKIELRPAANATANGGAELERLRKICLALPDTTEKMAWSAPTFRVHGRQFAMFLDNHHGDGRIAVWCNAPEGVQRDLVAADPKRFYVPPYVGVGGWVGVRLDRKLATGALTALIEQAYRTTEQKRAATKRRKR